MHPENRHVLAVQKILKIISVILIACPLMVNGVWANTHMTSDHQDPHTLNHMHPAQMHSAQTYLESTHGVHDHGIGQDRDGGADHKADHQSGHQSDHQSDQDTDHDPTSHVHLYYMALLNIERVFSQRPRTNPVAFTSHLVGRLFSPPVPPPNV